MSTTEVSPAAFASALRVAEILKGQLEERLIGNTAHAWSCGCGACGAGPSKVVGIHMPTTYHYQIAMFFLWTCNMHDDVGKGWSQGISTYIPWSELYPLFRNAFAGIEVEVSHVYADLHYDKPDQFWGDSAAKDERNFTPSGRTVVVNDENPAWIQPIGDLTQSTWVNAELRIDANLKEYSTTEPRLACNIDPLEFGQRHGRGVGRYFNLADPSELPTFYIRIPDAGKDLYSPIARLVALDQTTGEATFELDQMVESVSPTV